MLIAAPLVLPKGPGSVITTSLEKASPSEEKKDYGGISAVWKSIKSTGISEHSCKLIMSSWRSGTRKQYGTYIQQWIEFCDKQESDFLHPSVGKVLDFLTMLYKKGLSYTAVNTARGALSSLHSLPDGSTIGKHPLVSRLLKGVFQNRPPQPRYSTVWDVTTGVNTFPANAFNQGPFFEGTYIEISYVTVVSYWPKRSNHSRFRRKQYHSMLMTHICLLLWSIFSEVDQGTLTLSSLLKHITKMKGCVYLHTLRSTYMYVGLGSLEVQSHIYLYVLLNPTRE